MIARYERESCPLDMGPRPSPVGLGRRVPYVPSAALLASVEALRTVDGFDADLRYGEDVDLIWRLGRLGKVCRYEPAVQVLHLPRSSLSGFIRQRFHYGASAVALEQRHPGALAPVRASKSSLAAAVAIPVAGPLPALAVAAFSARKLEGSLPALRGREAFAVTTGGVLAAAGAVAKALSREWLPLTLIAAIAGRVPRRLAILGAASVAYEGFARRPVGSLPAALVLGLLDRITYAAGLWASGLKRPRALLGAVVCRHPRADR